MIIGLLGFNIIIFLCTFLGITMFSNHLKRISKSIDIYLDPKAYKPKNQVKLISLLVDKYQSYEDKSLIDIDSLIYDCFYHNKIGKFKPSRIESLAKKGKRLLWASIITMTLFEEITLGLGQSHPNSIMIIISALIGIVLAFIEIYKDIQIGKEKLFLKIKNHLINEYPQFKTSQKEKQKVSLLLSKIDKLEAQIKKPEQAPSPTIYEEKIQENELQEEDIANIINHFDISLM